MKLVYHPAVEIELVVAARFYEQQVHGLGTLFLDEFERGVAAILDAPERRRIVTGDKRRLLRFPYGLYYRVLGDEVRVLVLKHHSRHPGYGMNRE